MVGKQHIRRIGRQQQDDARRGFFEGFQQGVLGARGGILETQQQRHPVTGLVGRQRQAALQLAHRLHLDGAVFSVGLQDGEIRVLQFFDLGAATAGKAGDARLQRLGAVEGLGKAHRQAAAAYAGRAGKQVGMARLRAGDVLLQQAGGPFVAE